MLPLKVHDPVQVHGLDQGPNLALVRGLRLVQGQDHEVVQNQGQRNHPLDHVPDQNRLQDLAQPQEVPEAHPPDQEARVQLIQKSHHIQILLAKEVGVSRQVPLLREKNQGLKILLKSILGVNCYL
ncbi:hypothetical protein Anas_12786 [Armadillidium nasatum]|uniref:Uncharacterized protein n=1 Tax=Armadillidium nasatum TaxID=96803 RepID=A0A5N5T9A5_9CRUS|nr:hypothetical protein Anas_12786 [Armadillidium nasatum]